VPSADIIFPTSLNLASLTSIREFAQKLSSMVDHVDVLINNAGVMGVPSRKETADGFELQFGTNHLGNFLLTSLVMPLLRRSKQTPRVVTVSSLYARQGKIDWTDLQLANGNYTAFGAYGQSKLSNLIFAKELQARADNAGVKLISTAVHPGYSATSLQTSGTEMNPTMMWIVNGIFAQSAEMGALPTLYGAVSDEVKPGGFYGPRGIYELWGYPTDAWVNPIADDVDVRKKLWGASVKLVGVKEADFFASK
jgi:NAD(P)-dependent dehydrogenase (short-subunit alcohol dehydrogenase family)